MRQKAVAPLDFQSLYVRFRSIRVGHNRRDPAANVRNVPKADIVWAQSRGQLANARMSRPGPPPMTRIHLSGDERLVGPPLAMGCQQPCSVVTGVVSFSAFNVARGVVAEFPAW